LPAIVVTLGMSFVWTGLAVMILPAPGGAAPDWIRAIMTVKPPFACRWAIVASVVIAVVAHLIIARSSLGVLIRGVGGNERSVARAGWSVVQARAAAYALAGCSGAGGDGAGGARDIGRCQYRAALHAVVHRGVILGGGEFTGGGCRPWARWWAR
jgi:ribose transport system permease protein